MRSNPDKRDALHRELRPGEMPPRFDSSVTPPAHPTLNRAETPPASDGLRTCPYTPMGKYHVGETVTYQGQDATVVAIRRQRNPRQGTFSVVDLQTEDGTVTRLVSGVASRVLAYTPQSDYPAECPSGSLRMGTLGASRSRGLFAETVLTAYAEGEMPSDAGVPQWLQARVSALHSLVASAREEGEDWNDRETWRRVVLPTLHLLGWSESGPPTGGCYDLVMGASVHDLEPAVRAGEVRVTVRPVPWANDIGTAGQGSAAGCPAIDLIGHLVSGGAAWGILTNGRQWRLYATSCGDPDISSTAATFHEFDLTDIMPALDGDDRHRRSLDTRLRLSQWRDLMLWSVLYGASSYVSTDLTPSLVEGLKHETADYAWQATRRLQTTLFDRVPEIVSEFLASRQKMLRATGPTLAAVEVPQNQAIDGALGLIARLLCVLFAEKHGLLPMGYPDYRGQSITTLQRWAIAQIRDGGPLSDRLAVTPRYDALMDRFRQLEHGAPNLGLPSYSGGLFSPLDSTYRFLEGHRLSDCIVARTLAALGGVSVDGDAAADDDGLRPCDYTAFSVRHLVAVCEGLMRYAQTQAAGAPLRAARAPLRAARAPLEAAGAPLEAGAAGDQAGPKRRASQSDAARLARAPDYVGQVAIERMLQQVLDERAETFAQAMDHIVALRGSGASAADDAAGVAPPAHLAAVQDAERAASRTLLGLKVLDPAARAGGLLVAALDTLTDGIIGILARYHTEHPTVPLAWDPVYREIQDMKGILAGDMTAQDGASVGLALDNAGVLARLIAERVLYGVERNALAAKLVRTSLQMRVFAGGAPFAPLQHHLRCGDSLKSMRLFEIRDAAPVLADVLPDLRGALTPDTSVDGADHPFSQASVDSRTRVYEALLSIWLSEDYGNLGARELVRRHGPHILAALRGEVALDPAKHKIVATAQELAATHGFLHWEIAFPEVFLTPDAGLAEWQGGVRSDTDADRSRWSSAGFDIVLGRPPSGLELGSTAVTGPGGGYNPVSFSERRGPFTALANRLVRRPGGRIAFLIASSEVRAS
jgi:hypothetical protein